MRNHIFMLLFGTPRRVAGVAVILAVIFATVSPEHFNWVLARAFRGLWPLIQIVGFGAIVVGVFMAAIRPSKKGGS